MIDRWSRLSDTYKILITMLFLIMTIQLSSLIYIWKFESKILLEKEQKNLVYQLDVNAKLLISYLNGLKKELGFLSSLEVMDDVLVKDIDKRIKIFLEKKSKDLSKDIVLLAVSKGKVIASSCNNYKKDEFLEFRVDIHASFNREKKIGELLLLYPLKNLMTLTIENPYQKLWLETKLYKGFNPSYTKDSIVVLKKLDTVLHGWTLYLSYKKKYALVVIKEIEGIVFWSFLFSLFSLLLVIWILSKKQINILHQTEDILELKRTFLSTMSHELRTPLGSILAMTQHLMVKPNIEDSDVDMLRKIENSSEHLLSMINNLLQLSKLESHTMTINRERVDIIVLIRDIIELVEPLIDEKDLQLEVKLIEGKKEIITDRHLFGQVIINLLSNAIKYTKEGSIHILLSEKDATFELIVLDTGIGIAKDKQDALFSEFYQAHMDSGDIKHSTGLGLALSQKVAKMINGEIEIESEGIDCGVRALFRFSSLKLL